VSEGAAKKEEKPRKFQAIRGTRDLLPPETALWDRVEQTAHKVFTTFGFGEIRLPIMEPKELFARSVGEETDIVTREMYVFEEKLEFLRHNLGELQDALTDLGRLNRYLQIAAVFSRNLDEAFESGEVSEAGPNGQLSRQLRAYIIKSIQRWNEGAQTPDDEWRDLLNRISAIIRHVDLGDRASLRPEATASVARAYIEHNMQQLPQPVKLYYMGPMFRRERPQKGRYRQFYQIGAEVLGGGDAPAIDAEVIEMVMTFFDRLELQGVQLDINSIGDKNCRPKYVELLRAELLKVKDKLGPDSQRRIETNPLRVLDSKLESEQGIIATLPRIGDHLCEECAAHYAAVKHQLEMRGVIYRENWRLVRGLLHAHNL
jgi:histidyl-tRNA synthetase